MRLSINYMSRNRLLGKAMRRVRPQLEELFAALRDVAVESERYANVVLWISDNPPQHYEEIDKTQEHLSVYVGYPLDFSFRAEDDRLLLRILLDRIEYFVKQSQMCTTDVAGIRNAIERWRTEKAIV